MDAAAGSGDAVRACDDIWTTVVPPTVSIVDKCDT
jgi:hypothetical protein